MRELSQRQDDERKWVSVILFFAALYNLAWGAIASVAPVQMLTFAGITNPGYVGFWQCIGMFVALYGVGYWFASTDPVRYWPFVAIGLAGKMLGPVGAVAGILSGELPVRFLLINVTNDFIWWVPFVWALVVIRRWNLRATFPEGAPLYRRVIGPEFERLTPRIREFHNATSPVEVRGVFQVTRGKSALGNWLTDVARFPRAHDALDVSLWVEPTANGELWRRRFADAEVESWQFESRGLLAERFGPLVLYLRARVVEGALEVNDLHSTFWGVPLPAFFAPNVRARGIDNGEGIDVSVRITCAPLGLLVEYKGVVA